MREPTHMQQTIGINSGLPDPARRRTRLAPSPTGALHLGNARTFLVNWALARQQRWDILLRIEDLDGPRVKPGADAAAIHDLQWLGLDWDAGPTYQLPDIHVYRSALQTLASRGLAYPCRCTRKDMAEAASAPNGAEHDLRYPGTCRVQQHNVLPSSQPDTAWRFCVEPGLVCFNDEVAGSQAVNVDAQTGDFVIWTKADLPAYQLAVVVDDLRQGITDVVRGDDLIPSTARQLLLYDQLAGDAVLPPRWWHLPLVVGPDGRRLAKRHGDSRIAWYRQQGVHPSRIIGLLASWCGLADKPQPMDAAAFLQRFDIARLPHGNVTFTTEMHQWLLQS